MYIQRERVIGRALIRSMIILRVEKKNEFYSDRRRLVMFTTFQRPAGDGTRRDGRSPAGENRRFVIEFGSKTTGSPVGGRRG